MPVSELASWTAFERLQGPILAHDRIDFGMAQVAFVMAQLWAKKRLTFRHFLPGWFRRQTAGSRKPEAVKAAFEQLLHIAEQGGEWYADDQQPRRPADG